MPQIHYVQRPGGSRQQLTFEREPIGGATVCPDASKQGFIFSRDAGGNENFQVPNVRGSTGYGKTYVKLDNGFLRENSVKDIGALLDWVQRQPNLDAGRVAVFGGSYGGYMSLASMTNYNARFKCGIDLFGISNFVTFLKNTSAYRQDLRRVEYGDERDPKMNAHQLKISPMTNIKNITKPMLVYQGKNDPRVPLSESEQMVEALKQNNVPVWYIMAKNEGHGITKKANRDQVNAAVAEFLGKYLIGEPLK